MALGPIRYCGPFLFALSIPALYYALGRFYPLLTVAALLLFLLGAERVSRSVASAHAEDEAVTYRLLPFIYIPFQLGIIVWALCQAQQATLAERAVLAISVGVTTGVFGVLAAHELVHGDDRIGQIFGLVLLSAMSYRHFRIAHVLGHHRWAATERDPATARLGEGFYRFIVRTLVGQYLDAWCIEQERLAMRHLPFWKHRVAGDMAAMSGVFLAVLLVTGWRSLELFLTQSAVAIIVLELFNYIAHYGLLRRSDERGREPFGKSHSWNSSNVLANAVIFNMGRHTHHHARPFAPYHTLRPQSEAPELPWGYAGSILLALVPPLWQRVMDPAVQRLHTWSNDAPV